MEMAIWLTQSRFCRQQADLPCGVCRECRLVAANDYTDLHIVSPDGRQSKTQQIRELLPRLLSQVLSNPMVIIDAENCMSMLPMHC